ITPISQCPFTGRPHTIEPIPEGLRYPRQTPILRDDNPPVVFGITIHRAGQLRNFVLAHEHILRDMVENNADPTDRSCHEVRFGDNATFSFPDPDAYRRLLWVGSHDQFRVHWPITVSSHRGPHANRNRRIQELLRLFDNGFDSAHGLEVTRPSFIGYGPLVLTRHPTLHLRVDKSCLAEDR